MVDGVSSLSLGVVATFVPLSLGLLAPKILVKRPNTKVTVWLVSAAAGVVFWFFLDVMLDAVELDVNQGFSRSYTLLEVGSHVALALTFALGVGLLFGLERRLSSFSHSSSPLTGGKGREDDPTRDPPFEGLSFAVAGMAALAVGFHALGEGVAIGSSLPYSSDILSAIGGFLPGVAYFLHKLLEGFVIGVFALVSSAASIRKIGMLVAVSGVPTVIGFFVGFPAILDPTYFFALGGAGALYIEIKLVPLFSRRDRSYASILPLLLGFYAMYFAGLFHS